MEDIGEGEGRICDRRHLPDSTIGIFRINGPSSLPPSLNVPLNLVQSATGEEVGGWKGNSRAKLSQAAFAFSIGDVIYATVDRMIPIRLCFQYVHVCAFTCHEYVRV